MSGLRSPWQKVRAIAPGRLASESSTDLLRDGALEEIDQCG
jgi:hypothetical protein